MPEIQTPDNLQYQFFPASSGYCNFRVRTPNDAHIALTSGPSDTQPILEIFLGGWSNSKSIIRKNKTEPNVAEANTPGIVSPGEFRGFWVRWFNGVITVGRENEPTAFMSFEDRSPFPINYVGFCTGWGASGSWIIEDKAPVSAGYSAPPPASAPGWGGAGGNPGYWVPARGGEVPQGAVSAGFDGENMFIARARHGGALLPGKLLASHGCAYVPWGGKENAAQDYEVLCHGNGQWIRCSGSQIPPNAFPAGESEGGEPLFIGRVNHEGSLTIGKVQASHGACYIPYGGSELSYTEYEIYLA